MANLRNQKGMTLIEVVVTLVIASILLGVFYFALDWTILSFSKEDTRVEMQENMRLASIRIDQDLRESNQLASDDVFPDTDNCYKIDKGSTNEVSYCLSGNTIARNGVVIAGKVDSFSLLTTDNVVTIKIISQNDKYGQNVTVDTQVSLRGAR